MESMKSSDSDEWKRENGDQTNADKNDSIIQSNFNKKAQPTQKIIIIIIQK